MKSYNAQALRGLDISDDEFAEEMADAGIRIPQHLLYTPKMNDYVLDAMNKQTVRNALASPDPNPDTGEPWTLKEAQAMADKHTSQSRQIIYALMDASN